MGCEAREDTVKLWAVIPSKERRTELFALVARLLNDDVNVVIVDTGYEPRLDFAETDRVHIIRFVDRLNISFWWNVGLGYVAASENFSGDYVVAVLNDDVIVPPQFVQRLATAIGQYNVVAAFPDVYGLNADYALTWPVRDGLRMSGFAFALSGKAGIMADERFVWWYGDNDIEYQARQKGGAVLVGGLKIQHLYPNSTTTAELAQQAGRDRVAFVEKWGQPPW
jgi:GT2 family glycosyltransferase